MAARKSLLAGMAIGAGAALVRELVGFLRRRDRSSQMYWCDGPELEPEDARTETHVPNARRTRNSVRSADWIRAAEQARTPRESRDGEWARQAAKNPHKQSPDAAPKPEFQPHINTGRTVTPTESELRRSPISSTGPVGEPGTPAPDGTVDYTNPKSQPAQGGEAPFIRKD